MVMCAKAPILLICQRLQLPKRMKNGHITLRVSMFCTVMLHTIALVYKDSPKGSNPANSHMAVWIYVSTPQDFSVHVIKQIIEQLGCSY